MKVSHMALLVRNVFLPYLNHPGNGTGTFLIYNFTQRSVETSKQWVTSGTLDNLVSSLKIIRWPFLFEDVNLSPNDFIHVLSMSSRLCIMSTCLKLWSSSACNTLAVGAFLGVLGFSRSRSASETLVVDWEAGRRLGKGFMLQFKRCLWLLFFTKLLAKRS